MPLTNFGITAQKLAITFPEMTLCSYTAQLMD